MPSPKVTSLESGKLLSERHMALGLFGNWNLASQPLGLASYGYFPPSSGFNVRLPHIQKLSSISPLVPSAASLDKGKVDSTLHMSRAEKFKIPVCKIPAKFFLRAK